MLMELSRENDFDNVDESMAESLEQFRRRCVGKTDNWSCICKLLLTFWENVRIGKWFGWLDSPFVDVF